MRSTTERLQDLVEELENYIEYLDHEVEGSASLVTRSIADRLRLILQQTQR